MVMSKQMELVRIDTALVKVGFCRFEMCFKDMSRTKWAVSSKHMIE